MGEDSIPGGLIKAIADLFGTSKERVLLLVSLGLAGLVMAYADGNGYLKDVDRVWITLAYGVVIVCWIFLATLFLVTLWSRISSRVTTWSAVRACKTNSRKNFAHISSTHRRVLVYLKQRGQKRFLEDTYNTLTAMVASGYLDSSSATFNQEWYEVPDWVWNSEELSSWATRSHLETEPPYYPTSWRV